MLGLDSWTHLVQTSVSVKIILGKHQPSKVWKCWLRVFCFDLFFQISDVICRMFYGWDPHVHTFTDSTFYKTSLGGGAPPILEISVFHISVDCKCSLIFFHFIQWQTAKSAPLTISQINKLTNIFTPFQQNVPSIYGPSWPRVGVGLNLNRLHNTKRRNISEFTPTGNLFSPDIQF